MKTRVLYFALAVAAAAIASSCVKEQAEPMDPEAEITGQVFEASHEVITKSTLVDLTPTWVEGDQISVTGSDETAVCTFVAGTENKFQTEEGVTVESPFYAIYPAADGHSVNRETGVFTATVPSLQKIDVTKGQNVAQGALVAVAQSETPELQFKNAVGLVKLNITRPDIAAVKIESINVTDVNAEAEYVAGQFTMTLPAEEGQEPTVKLVEGTGITSVILNPAEENGTFEQGEYYATVLPCKLSGIIVTFTRRYQDAEGNYKTESINVRKTATTEIKRNAGIDLGSFFTYEISDADDLLAWNKAAAKWTVWDNVVLTDNIDCSTIKSEDWTPNEFKGVFDGNGKTIDNFVIEKEGPAAFFSGLASATVKDLTFGAGCSFTSKAEWTGVATRIYAGSLAADATGTTTLTNVVNKGAVKTSSSVTGGSTGNYVGGICAYHRATGAVTGCENHGEISFPATAGGHVWCGGLFGYVEKEAAIVNSTNRGHVVFNGTNSGNKALYLGGITAEVKTASFNTCVNLGSVEINATAAHGGNAFMGGIVGVNGAGKLGTITGCVNGSESDSALGAVTNNSNTSGVLRVGGFIGYVVTNASDITGFKNYGPITNNGEIGNWAGLGGVVGYVGALSAVNTVSGCENHGTVLNTKVKAKMNVGGIVGFIQNAKTDVTGCNNYGEVKNTGTSPSNIGVTVAGIIGRIEAGENYANTISLCNNEGAISYAAKNEGDETYFSGVAGILGGHTGNSGTKAATVTIDQCTNLGSITKSENGNTYMYIGGIAGFFSGTEDSASNIANVTNCTNGDPKVATKGEISNASTNYGAWHNYIGGIVGYHRVSGKIESCYNYASVTNKAQSTQWDGIRVGGIGGNINATSMTDCTNYGVVSDQSTSATGQVGGIVARIDGTGMTMVNCDNKGNVSGLFNTTDKRTALAVGGIVGLNYAELEMSLCDNTGDVHQSNIVANTVEYVGGIIASAQAKATISECSHNAKVTTARTEPKYVGVVSGRFYATGSTVVSTKVCGTYQDEPLDETNYADYCFGTSSENKITTGITYGTAE